MFGIRRGRGGPVDVVHGLIAIGDQGPDHAALFDLFARDNPVFGVRDKAFGIVPTVQQSARHDQAFDLNIAIHRLGPQVAAELRFGVEIVDREIALAAVLDIDRFVIGKEFGAQRQAEQNAKDDQRPIGPTVAAKVAPAAFREGGQGHHGLGPPALEIDAGIDKDIHQVRQDTDQQPHQAKHIKRAEHDGIVAIDRRLKPETAQPIQ